MDTYLKYIKILEETISLERKKLDLLKEKEENIAKTISSLSLELTKAQEKYEKETKIEEENTLKEVIRIIMLFSFLGMVFLIFTNFNMGALNPFILFFILFSIVINTVGFISLKKITKYYDNYRLNNSLSLTKSKTNILDLVKEETEKISEKRDIALEKDALNEDINKKEQELANLRKVLEEHLKPLVYELLSKEETQNDERYLQASLMIRKLIPEDSLKV